MRRAARSGATFVLATESRRGPDTLTYSRAASLPCPSLSPALTLILLWGAHDTHAGPRLFVPFPGCLMVRGSRFPGCLYVHFRRARYLVLRSERASERGAVAWGKSRPLLPTSLFSAFPYISKVCLRFWRSVCPQCYHRSPRAYILSSPWSLLGSIAGIPVSFVHFVPRFGYL